MSKFVERVSFSESTNGLPIAVKNEAKDIHFVPEGSLDEIWAWVSASTSTPTTATVRLSNVDIEFAINSNNSPVLVTPGVSVDKYGSEPSLKVTTTGDVVVHGYINRIG
jgi:hypothetical protein